LHILTSTFLGSRREGKRFWTDCEGWWVFPEISLILIYSWIDLLLIIELIIDLLMLVQL